MAVELTTSRLRLRRAEQRDARRLAEYLGDYEVVKTLSGAPHPYSLGMAAEWIGRAIELDDRKHVNLIIDDGEGLIGNVSLRDLAGVPEIGYWIARHCWGRGLMSEAAGAVVDWFFQRHDHPKLLSGCFIGNPASLRIQKKLGFTVVGRSMRYCTARERDLDHIDTELLRTRHVALAQSS